MDHSQQADEEDRSQQDLGLQHASGPRFLKPHTHEFDHLSIIWCKTLGHQNIQLHPITLGSQGFRLLFMHC
jgi:hypothetical protein